MPNADGRTEMMMLPCSINCYRRRILYQKKTYICYNITVSCGSGLGGDHHTGSWCCWCPPLLHYSSDGRDQNFEVETETETFILGLVESRPRPRLLFWVSFDRDRDRDFHFWSHGIETETETFILGLVESRPRPRL